MSETAKPVRDPLLKNGEVAALLGIHPVTMRKLRRENRGPAFVLVGGRARYRQEDVADWIATHTKRAA